MELGGGSPANVVPGFYHRREQAMHRRQLVMMVTKLDLYHK